MDQRVEDKWKEDAKRDFEQKVQEAGISRSSVLRRHSAFSHSARSSVGHDRSAQIEPYTPDSIASRRSESSRQGRGSPIKRGRTRTPIDERIAKEELRRANLRAQQLLHQDLGESSYPSTAWE